MTVEEQGKIVSADAAFAASEKLSTSSQHIVWIVALHLCNFADAIRAWCAEAKGSHAQRQQKALDAIRAWCAEAKLRGSGA